MLTCDADVITVLIYIFLASGFSGNQNSRFLDEMLRTRTGCLLIEKLLNCVSFLLLCSDFLELLRTSGAVGNLVVATKVNQKETKKTLIELKVCLGKPPY